MRKKEEKQSPFSAEYTSIVYCTFNSTLYAVIKDQALFVAFLFVVLTVRGCYNNILLFHCDNYFRLVNNLKFLRGVKFAFSTFGIQLQEICANFFSLCQL